MNNIRNFISSSVRRYLNELGVSDKPSDYTGQHSAPEKEGDKPMYDVSEMFPDMYNENAYRYYSGYGLDDNSVINQIKSVHGKPNKFIKIYRAVPYLNRDIDKRIKELNQLISYYLKFRFFPLNNKIIDNIESKYEHINDYDETKKAILDDLYSQIKDLNNKKEKSIKINNGDWVTTSILYAKQHGVSNLNNNYKIVTKTVKASQLYTDGNSIFEWGYNL